MPRDERAYLVDIIDSCDAILDAVAEMDLAAYDNDRLVRSSVEREFLIIGEAVNALARVAPSAFEAISRGRRIVDFRNQLAHQYSTVDNAIVWAIVENDVPILRRECTKILDSSSPANQN